MNLVTIGIGLAAICFGCYTTLLRFKNPSKLGKLGPMKARWGDTAGPAIHTVAYSVAPVAAGISFCVAGVNGVALF